jgi:hypothetical protein
MWQTQQLQTRTMVVRRKLDARLWGASAPAGNPARECGIAGVLLGEAWALPGWQLVSDDL